MRTRKIKNVLSTPTTEVVGIFTIERSREAATEATTTIVEKRFDAQEKVSIAARSISNVIFASKRA